VSTHVALRKACDLVTKDRVLKVIQLVNNACKKFGIEEPEIGIAGLNPHASDGGLFGTEEKEEIIPAMEAAEAEGMNVAGPMAPDTLYPKAKGGFFDAVVAMYHDQGHIPFKMKGFVWDKESQSWGKITGVNITLGLPIIRTSVDHGTAFDIAGTGQADHESLVNALEYASLLAENRRLA
ncbi:MAG TPA: 4-hydroxythreonine-4-phosphate dehydrogenase PdxA, partial [Fodinibius sp.]|nr:4-hydroxythreonine-4-phosphate dehydrogenase PdxA [Fodinibius sp.]